MVQKSAKEEEIKDKGGKYHIYIPVYMELHIWGPMISASFALFFCTLLALSKFAENQIFRAVTSAPTRTCHQVRFWFIIFLLASSSTAYVYLYTGICLSWALKPATSMQ